MNNIRKTMIKRARRVFRLRKINKRRDVKMSNIRKTMIKRARRVFRLRKINKGRDVKMSNIKNELRKAKGKAFKRQMNDACFYVRELFARVVKTFFSHGKVVSDAHNQQANNTSSSLLIMGEKKNKGRREIKMNNLTEKARRINEAGSKENSIKRGRKMINNMTEIRTEDARSRLIRRVSVTGWMLGLTNVLRKFGKRETEFPDPQTDYKLRAKSLGKDGLANGRSVSINEDRNFGDDAVNRWFGKRETGERFTVSQIKRELGVVKRVRDTYANGRAFAGSQEESVKGMLAGFVREVFSFGKIVSDTSNQQVNNTLFGLVMTDERKNKTRRNLRMNKLTKKTLRRGARSIFCGKVVPDAHNQQANNTSFGLVMTGEKKNKTRRKVEMNTKENTLHQDKSCEAQAEKRIISVLAHGKIFVSNRAKRGEVICVGLARDIFSIGRRVSDAHNRQANNTLFGLVMTDEKKNKIRRKIKMNNITNKAEKIFTERKRFNQEGNNTSASKRSRLATIESQENRTKRGVKMMNNTKQGFTKRMRRISGIGRSLVFSLIKVEEKFGERSLKSKASTCRMEREFGERQTGKRFPVPQTGGELSLVCLAGKTLFSLLNRFGVRRFGKRQMGERFPVSQTGSKTRAVKHAESVFAERRFGERETGKQFTVSQTDGDLRATKPSSLVEACSAGRDVGRKVRIAKRGRSVLAHGKAFVSNRTGLMFKRSRDGLAGLTRAVALSRRSRFSRLEFVVSSSSRLVNKLPTGLAILSRFVSKALAGLSSLLHFVKNSFVGSLGALGLMFKKSLISLAGITRALALLSRLRLEAWKSCLSRLANKTLFSLSNRFGLRRFGKRQTGEQFTVPQTGNKAGAVNAAKSRYADEKAFLRWISNLVGIGRSFDFSWINQRAKDVCAKGKSVLINTEENFVDQTGERKFGKRETGERFPVSQTGSKTRAVKHAESVFAERSSIPQMRSELQTAKLTKRDFTSVRCTGSESKSSQQEVERRFGERPTGFTVPQTDGDLQATKPSSLVEACSAGRDVGRKVRIAKRGRSVLAHEKIFVSNRTGLMFKRFRNSLSGLGLSNRLGLRRFGKRQTGERFPAPQTDCKALAGLLGVSRASKLVNKTMVKISGLISCDHRGVEKHENGLAGLLRLVSKALFGLSNRLGSRRFGKRETGERFPVSQTGRELGIVNRVRDTYANGRDFTDSQAEHGKVICGGLARRVFSYGKRVSGAINRQTSNTLLSPLRRLLMMEGGKKNKTRRSLKMNKLKKTLRKGVRKMLLGMRSMFGRAAQRSLSGIGNRATKIRRNLELKRAVVGVCAVALVAAVLYGFGLSGAVHGQTPQPTPIPQPTPQIVNQYPPPSQINNVPTAPDTDIIAKDSYIVLRAGTRKEYDLSRSYQNINNVGTTNLSVRIHKKIDQLGTISSIQSAGSAQPSGKVAYDAAKGKKGTDVVEYFILRFRPRSGVYSTTVPARYYYSNLAKLHVIVTPDGGVEEAGDACRWGMPSPNVGMPVNVMTGNMWLEQTDYSAGRLDLNRFYNTVVQTDGLFGKGWRTQFDESLEAYGDLMVRVNMADGRAVYLRRKDTTSAYKLSPQKYIGEVVKEADGSYLLKLKDGRESKFTAAGRLEWKKDRNGNQTTLTYDANGNLTKITDAFGRSLTFTMTGGRVTQVSDALGKVADYAYNADGTLQSVTYADNSRYQFEYTTINNKKYMTAVKDALNNVLEAHSYDAQGRAVTSERHGGVDKQTISYGQTSGGNTYTSVTDGLGRVTKYNYKKAALSGLKQLTSVEGNCDCGSGAEKTSYEYDDNWNVVKETDALGNATSYTHDADGNMLTATDALGTITYTYNQFGQVLTATDQMGGVTTNTYDANRNLLTTKDALNNTTVFTYTIKGQLATMTDARNNTTTFAYDASGQLTRVTDADNKATNYAYDARSRLTSITNALNEKTSYTYDANNRLKRITYPDNNYREFTYDLGGRRTQVRDEKGSLTNFTYDAAYRLTRVADALNKTVSYSYDVMSNMTAVTDGVGKTTNYEYDNFDRLTKIVYPAAATGAKRLEERYEYDAVGNVVKHINTAQRETVSTYDDLYRLTSVTNALNQQTTYGYEKVSRYGSNFMRVKVTDAAGQTYFLEYDALGRVKTKVRGDWKANYRYDEVGNLSKRTNYRNLATNYTYDKLNRLIRKSYAGNRRETVNYTYDALGRMVSAVNRSGTVTFTYDNRGRLVSENDVHGQVIRYGYEANGNRASLSLNGTNHTTYAYDAANRLTTLTSAADNAQFRYSYDKADRLKSKVLPNGITTTYEYDGLSRLTRLRDATAVKTHYDRQYSYDAASRISRITEPAKTRNFAYDPLDRLMGMTSPTAGSERGKLLV